MLTVTSSWKTRLQRAAIIPVLLVGLLGLTVLLAIPASAVPGLGLVGVISPATDVNKNVVASCPGNQQLTGVGGSTDNPEVIMGDLYPLNFSEVSVRGVEDDPVATNWRVKAYAICADPLPGHVQIPAASPSNPTDIKAVTASCPQDTSLIGAGGDIRDGGGDVLITAIIPNSASNSVTVTSIEEDPTAVNWSVRATAFCAKPVPGLVITQSPPVAGGLPAIATCPPGTHVHGTGGAITNGADSVGINRITPNPALDQVTVTGAAVDPIGANFLQVAYAICAA